MSFLPQIDKIYFPSVIGMPKKDLDRLVEHLDGYYREWSKDKLDKETGLSKKDKNGNIKSRIVRESKGIIKDIQGAFPNTFLGPKFTPFPHHENKLKPLLIKIK